MQQDETPQLTVNPDSLTDQEIALLSLLRSEVYEAIQIKVRDNGDLALDLLQVHDSKSKLTDLLRENPFQTLTVKTHQGRVTHIEQIEKRILKA